MAGARPTSDARHRRGDRAQPAIDPAGQARRCGDDREPGPRAGRLREAGAVRPGHAGRLPPAPLRPPPLRRGDPGRGRRRAGGLRSVLSHVLDVPRPAGALPRRPLRPARASGPGDRQGPAGERWRSSHGPGCGRLEWSVLNWNAPAIGFYRSLGPGRWTSGPSIGSTTAHSPSWPHWHRPSEPHDPCLDGVAPRMTASFQPHIARMAGYVPGEQPQGGGFIKLNTNENPYPPSPRVLEALSRALTDRLRLYPDPLATAFRRAAAALHGVEPDMILAGNGSDDLLTIITRAFVGPGDLAAYPTPSYLLYSTLIRLQDGREHVVPYSPDWTLNPADFDQPDLKLVYLANPNSPSGTSLTRHQVAELAGPPLPAGRRRGLRRLRRRALHLPGPRPPQRDRHALLQQGLQPGRNPPGIPGRPGRDRAISSSRSRTRTTATPSAWRRASPRSRTRTIWARPAPRSWPPAAG